MYIFLLHIYNFPLIGITTFTVIHRPNQHILHPPKMPNKMTTDAAARINSSEAKNGSSSSNGNGNGGFGSRANSAADKNINNGSTTHQGGKKK